MKCFKFQTESQIVAILQTEGNTATPLAQVVTNDINIPVELSQHILFPSDAPSTSTDASVRPGLVAQETSFLQQGSLQKGNLRTSDDISGFQSFNVFEGMHLGMLTHFSKISFLIYLYNT